jgi:hypothetical protein
MTFDEISHSSSHVSLLTFVFLASASIAQIFTVRTGNSHGFHTAIVFVAAAIVPCRRADRLMAIIQHVPEWLRQPP